jgi:hypothetical protein
MREDPEVWQALLRHKGLSVADLAERLGLTEQDARELLTRSRADGERQAELEEALALGPPAEGRPLYAVGELDDDGEVDIVPAGDAQPLFHKRELATDVAHQLETASANVCVVPVWPAYAWRNLVAFHAAWGAEPEPRKLFIVDETGDELPLVSIVEEVRAGLEATLRSRARAHDPASLGEVEARVQRLH